MSKKREYLTNIANENLEIYKNNYYINNLGNKIELNPSDKIITKTNFDNFAKPEIKENLNNSIIILEENCIKTLIDISNKYNQNTIGLLNFASARHPGGGFITGASAQEECICRCSNLYNQQLNSIYYEINAKSKSITYTDTMIITNTSFFRDENYKFLNEIINCCVITCPAVNMKFAKNTPEAQLTMKNRMRKIIETFIENNQENIILGAYGCGVFENNPTKIANDFKQILINENYIKYFNTVYFSILGEENYLPFKKVFSKYI